MAINNRKQTCSFSLSKEAIKLIRESARAAKMKRSAWLEKLILGDAPLPESTKFPFPKVIRQE